MDGPQAERADRRRTVCRVADWRWKTRSSWISCVDMRSTGRQRMRGALPSWWLIQARCEHGEQSTRRLLGIAGVGHWSTVSGRDGWRARGSTGSSTLGRRMWDIGSANRRTASDVPGGEAAEVAARCQAVGVIATAAAGESADHKTTENTSSPSRCVKRGPRRFGDGAGWVPSV